MDYVKHGEIQGRYLVFFKVTDLYFTMSDIVHAQIPRVSTYYY